MEVKKYGQKKASGTGNVRSAVSDNVPYLRKLAFATKVADCLIAVWGVLCFPLMLTFLVLMPWQLLCVVIAFGFPTMMCYVAIIALPLVYTIKKREEDSFKCLCGQKA
jgi:hypothetical protein